MYIYTVGCYPAFQYDNCFEEEYLCNENKYSAEEFEKQCKEAGLKSDVDEIVKHLKEKYGYKELNIQASIDINGMKNETK